MLGQPIELFLFPLLNAYMLSWFSNSVNVKAIVPYKPVLKIRY